MECKECKTELAGRQRLYCSKQCKTRAVTREWQTVNGVKRRKELVEYKGGKCQKCGYCKNIAALTFHHSNPDIKEFGLDMRRMCNSSLEALKKEADKCELLCHNCHMEEHYPHLTM